MVGRRHTPPVRWLAMPAPATTPATLLAGALRTSPARVLLTFYDDATGERAELSVATFANWVAKTANLCRDDLDLAVGTRVAIALPVHWQAAVWWQACWVSGFVGLPVGPGEPLPACDVAVVSIDGIDSQRSTRDSATPDTGREWPPNVVGLGLGPMGLPVRDRAAPAWVTLDFDREVHGHGDRFAPPPGLSPATVALASGGSAERTAGELAEHAVATGARWGLSAGDRTLVAAPYDDERALLAGLLVPLAAGSSAVLCRHLDQLGDEALARRVVAEGVTAVTGFSRRFPGSPTRELD
jgi:uncharacterized protein (TIGR03089 family)